MPVMACGLTEVSPAKKTPQVAGQGNPLVKGNDLVYHAMIVLHFYYIRGKNRISSKKHREPTQAASFERMKGANPGPLLIPKNQRGLLNVSFTSMENNYQLAHVLLEQYVRALIKVQAIDYLEIIGSGFIVRDSDKLFLVTAAHLFDHCNESTPICVNSANGKLVLIEGISQSSISEDGVRANDHVDISIIYLNDKCAEKLTGTSFLDIKQFDLSTKTKYPFGYWALGYPLTKNRGSILQADFEARTYLINVQEAREQIYSQMGLNREDNLLLHFDERRVYSENNEKRNAYSIRGFSGCPVWGLGEDGKFKLVSVLIEHHQSVHQTIVTTRIKKIINS